MGWPSRACNPGASARSSVSEMLPAEEEGYREAARRGFQPEQYYAGMAEFAAALRRDIAEKERLLRALNLRVE